MTADSSIREQLTAAVERRSKIPPEMFFHPIRGTFSQGYKLKTPWLTDYWKFRGRHDNATSSDLLLELQRLGADNSSLADRYRGALMGLMVGDALGVPLEFSPRDQSVVTEMIGGGPFGLEPGRWTDDTSMACCLAYSLLKCHGFDARHQMECYSLWYRYGAFEPSGKCFDIGIATREALEKFLATGNPYSGSADPRTAGNGSLMRLAPVVLYYFGDFESTVRFAAESSKLTHQAPEAVDACRYFAALLYGALKGETKDDLLRDLYTPVRGFWDKSPLSPAIELIARGSYRNKSRDQISSSGYVVDTLEAALWAFHRNSDCRSSLLAAVNLAGDSDTIGAVCGQLVGAFYGETGIPWEWIKKTHFAQAPYHFTEDFMARHART
jgi:ADP-ribosyl-[dinitrogen reductase] hydrolase